jgi:hypothetical protein
MGQSTISYLWRDEKAHKGFRTGVSLHSHTNQSHETLDFLANFGNQYPWMRPLLNRLEQRSERMHGVRIDYAASYWTPPMTPKLAFDLESRQVEKIDLAPMVSITDHDNINAPMLLRTVPSARQIPVSVEWTAPYGNQSFHLGMHNLPSAKATEWMKRWPISRPIPATCALQRFCARCMRSRMCWWSSTTPVGSLPDRQGEARVPGQRVPAKERQLSARAGAERAAQLG